MELRQLEYFREICRLGSVTAAADSLHVSQPSVTASIKRLEEEHGILLFDRVNRRLVLTSIGHEFLTDAEAILDRVQDAGRRLLDYRSEPKGRVRIGITPMMSVTLLPPTIARFQEEYPLVELQVVEEGSLTIAALLESGELDLGIMIIGNLAPPLTGRSIRQGEIYSCLPPGHALARFESVPLEALKDEPFILFREDTYSRKLIVAECRRLGFDPRIVFASSQIGTVAGLVREGMGVAFFFEDIARTLTPLEVRPLASRLELQAGVVWHSDRYVTSAVASLIEAFVEGAAGAVEKRVDK